MPTSSVNARAGQRARMQKWIGITALGAGLLGHLLAARAIGGSYVAYRDHLVGFVGLTVISGAVLAGLGSRFWKHRPDITLLSLGLLQALIGLLVYVERFSVHG